MTNEPPSSSDVERKVGKAVEEAARISSQASRAAKKMLSDMAGEMTEKKGYDVPALDLMDTNEEIIALVSLPGVSKEKIDLRLTEDTLSVEAPAAVMEGKYLRRESSPQGFKRDIKLPEEVKPEQVKAAFQNGILEVHMPKLVVVIPTTVKVE
jgi:HSP20 family protein